MRHIVEILEDRIDERANEKFSDNQMFDIYGRPIDIDDEAPKNKREPESEEIIGKNGEIIFRTE